jgi:hypothetical protein
MLDVSGDIPLMNFPTGPGGYTLTITAVSTPEPGSALLIGAGVLALFVKRRLAVSQ